MSNDQEQPKSTDPVKEQSDDVGAFAMSAASKAEMTNTAYNVVKC